MLNPTSEALSKPLEQEAYGPKLLIQASTGFFYRRTSGDLLDLKPELHHVRCER